MLSHNLFSKHHFEMIHAVVILKVDEKILTKIHYQYRHLFLDSGINKISIKLYKNKFFTLTFVCKTSLSYDDRVSLHFSDKQDENPP